MSPNQNASNAPRPLNPQAQNQSSAFNTKNFVTVVEEIQTSMNDLKRKLFEEDIDEDKGLVMYRKVRDLLTPKRRKLLNNEFIKLICEQLMSDTKDNE